MRGRPELWSPPRRTLGGATREDTRGYGGGSGSFSFPFRLNDKRKSSGSRSTYRVPRIRCPDGSVKNCKTDSPSPERYLQPRKRASSSPLPRVLFGLAESPRVLPSCIPPSELLTCEELRFSGSSSSMSSRKDLALE